MSRLRHQPTFVRFWAASTVSDFGTYVTALALQVLIVVTLGATATEVGIVNAARWLPYLLFISAARWCWVWSRCSRCCTRCPSRCSWC